MPDIYDSERGLKIGLTDDDYEDYQKGNLSDDFYARRKDGSIANRINVSPLESNDGNDENKETASGIDAGSAVIGALIMTAIGGAAYGIKKLWDKHNEKKAKIRSTEKSEARVSVQKRKSTQMTMEPAQTTLSTEAAKTDDVEQRLLTQEEAIQELMKVIIGMAEITDGKKKVSEGIENLSNAGIVDRTILLEKLSNPKVLENFNAYLESNLLLVMQNQEILSSIFGHSLIADGQYVPLAVSDIEQQLKIETIQED